MIGQSPDELVVTLFDVALELGGDHLVNLVSKVAIAKVNRALQVQNISLQCIHSVLHRRGMHQRSSRS